MTDGCSKTVKRVLWGAALMVWMGVIFYFSSQTGEESSEISGGITNLVAHLLWKDYDGLTVLEQTKRLGTLTFLVRKCAHFTEYGILGFLGSGLLSTWDYPKHPCRIRIGTAWIFSVLYAVSDELHQYFSDGRSPRIFDVMVDACGAAAGIGVFFLLAWLVTRLLINKEEKRRKFL